MQSNSVYASVHHNPIVHADSMSKLLCQNFFLTFSFIYISTGYVIKQLVDAFSCALSSTWEVWRALKEARVAAIASSLSMLLSCSPIFLHAP